MKKLFLVLGFVVALAVNVFAADTYAIDAGHTTIGFSVKHMMVSNTTGQFNKYDATISYDPKDLAASSISATVDVASIDTKNEKRDAHLKGADFFDTEKFPSITFVSKTINADSIVGDLTIKGVTKEVTIPVEISGPVVTPFGSTVIGINGSFKINRQDYGVSWNKTLDQGGLAVGDEVTVNISIEAAKK